ncbi:ankyrin repeat domain-containing protein [Allokutzneria sp. A3M-2-11 16]|uniref:ankyrin repeat domain-containing protein n=1 Tax=Allokutzneria sp. A3M-2-11 16 TaxID=2962043 RepID=UPI0020B84F1E|nr:ankyrin repeat domain-containing protein [Allokutzneria sp. A3M-2-11 16]MCP3805547.1 ankyrin repeat domain-containing protein [Allokutzneria sp. A3M-2-11 16]
MDSGPSLTRQPDLDQLRRRAKELRRAAAAGDPEALRRMTVHPCPPGPGATRLSAAQLVIAREHGFPSWPKLVAAVAQLTASRDEKAYALRHATTDWALPRARRLLAETPGLAASDIWTAAAVGEHRVVRELLATNPALATAIDGPPGNPPLTFACTSRWHRLDPARAVGLLKVVDLLLDAGAHLNGLPGWTEAVSPLGCAIDANHPALVRLLLERGADPDVHDGEPLYLAAEHADHECLSLLLAHGAAEPRSNALLRMIGRNDTAGVRLLTASTGDLSERGELVWHAVVHDCAPEVVQALLDAGAPISSQDDMTPLRLAVRRGNHTVAELLARAAAPAVVTDTDRFLGACMAADRVKALRLLDSSPGLLAGLTHQDLSLLCAAAENGLTDAVRLMLDLGFPVEAGGANQNPALHRASFHGRAEVVRLLLDHGVPPDGHDPDRYGTPLLSLLTALSFDQYVRPPVDWLGTAAALLAAGASTKDAWLPPQSREIAELLSQHGVAGDT